MDVLAAILVFVAVIAVTAVLFGGWLVVTVVRGLVRGLGLLLDPPRPRPTALTPDRVLCPRARCHAENPTGAQFCRRCGKPLAEPIPVPVRRAAVL
jgi:hypothetical protein